MGPAIGWRNCFYVLGAIGVCLAVIMLFLRETPRRHLAAAQAAASAAEPASRQSFKEILATLLTALRASPALGLTIAGGVTLHFILGAAAFDQLWYVQERGFDRDEIARLSGWLGLAGGILGNLFGGLGSDRFLARTGLGRPMFLFWVMLVLAPFNLAYRLVEPDSLWFYLGIFLGYFQLGCFYGPTFSTVQELVPPQIRATVVAFYILMLNFIGMGIGITAGGITVDVLAGAGVAEPYSATLLSFTVLSLLAVPLFYMAGRRYAQDRTALYERLSSP
jgi:predicted MFS family arabinose efflux permease